MQNSSRASFFHRRTPVLNNLRPPAGPVIASIITILFELSLLYARPRRSVLSVLACIVEREYLGGHLQPMRERRHHALSQPSKPILYRDSFHRFHSTTAPVSPSTPSRVPSHARLSIPLVVSSPGSLHAFDVKYLPRPCRARLQPVRPAVLLFPTLRDRLLTGLPLFLSNFFIFLLRERWR